MSGTEHEIKHAQNCFTLFYQNYCILSAICMLQNNIRPYDNGQLPDIFKFGWTNFTYIINRKIIEFAKDNECPDNFQSLL